MSNVQAHCHTLVRFMILPLLLSSVAVPASTRDDIAALYHPQGMATLPAPAAESTAGAAPVLPAPAPVPRWFTLSNGQRVNLADWKVVLFMQGHCPYCHAFDPLLKNISQQTGLSVFAYTLDGQGDTSYPAALPAPDAVMRTFFPGLPVATPTTFLVNVNTLDAWPLLQGASDEKTFLARLDTVLQDTRAGRQGGAE
ncbi:type-F conjugative transfer system pilin assembly thiol-disulfide isomerase TrbB [Cedecea sp. NFIX57]|uniref:type-F conjugative transfer system pilin assembly thiol-disulfide isomerase TrbB n=1 Tax=Cedecea sp. NFIX57 TaxID=1566286 RepID=UPI000A0E714C|nr:type-F conjugative transfer system pilin assembly thiol-disulfide isomerase TrbB [Cedecea sp. NFIX57]SMG59855.1 type-F conjugative transfer system pilin assembly thiol-disulfide isomerase TrbB [Cedecea sp. NFIX57]